MPSLRTLDVVLAEGTFRIALTERRRVVAVIDAPITALGPLHIVLAVDRKPFLPEGFSAFALAPSPSMETAGIFDDIGHAVEHAAEGAFNAVSKVATTIARPAFDALKTVTSEGIHFVAHALPFLPEGDRRKLDAAARTVMRAKLGDITAKQFIQGIADAAKAGVHAAQKIGDTLLDASKTVAHFYDLPVLALGGVPVVGDIVKAVSPFQKWDHIATAIQKGDVKKLGDIAREQLSLAQGVISLVPGVGTGISSALSAGLALLEGGSPLEVAIHAAYGAIPIPPGIRQVTDGVLETVLSLAFHGGGLTDVAIHVARDQVPAGLPRDVFDTLINLVGRHRPVQHDPGGLRDHYVQRYAHAGAHVDLPRALAHATAHLPNVFTALPHVVSSAAAARAHAAHPLLPPGSPRMVQPLPPVHA
jgi:hypothetical protein